MTGFTATNWTSLGLNGAPTATTEVSSITVADTGAITANVIPAVGGNNCAIVYTPALGASTAIRWSVSATTCSTVVQGIVAKWN